MRRTRWLTLLTLALVLLAGCGGPGEIAGPKVVVSICYGSEKREWLEPLVRQYNDARQDRLRGRPS